MPKQSNNDVSVTLFYATNRGHTGPNRFQPTGYGAGFSSDGQENLRFGKVTIKADQSQIEEYVTKDAEDNHWNGEALSGYFTDCAKKKSAVIKAYKEKIVSKKNEDEVLVHDEPVLGSKKFFMDLQAKMSKKQGKSSDVMIFIHGYNVSWEAAVGSAMALNWMQNNILKRSSCHVEVVLFSWPSNGSMLPYFAYSSDRSDARGSGKAFGRGMLKLRDFLHLLRDDCGRNLHLLCHSMGNYVLEQALRRLSSHHKRDHWPRMFDQVFLCAPDVNEDTLEDDKPLGNLHKLANSVSVYFNKGDIAMKISDRTKGNPDRLGSHGAARPNRLHHKIQQVDCAPVAQGLVEHSYYLWGPVVSDIRQSMEGMEPDSDKRNRKASRKYNNTWKIKD